MKRNELTNVMREVIASLIILIEAGKTDEEILSTITNPDLSEVKSELLRIAKEDFEKAKAEKEKTEKEKTNSAPKGRMFGNIDENKVHHFPGIWKDSVVIRESVVQKVGPKDSDVVEIPSSVSIKPFDKGLFDVHVKQGMFHKKKVEILHDPRK
jgi:hypothetical protein